jgi:hypothetical protein
LDLLQCPEERRLGFKGRLRGDGGRRRHVGRLRAEVVRVKVEVRRGCDPTAGHLHPVEAAAPEVARYTGGCKGAHCHYATK